MPPKSGLSSGTLGLKFMNRNPSKANAPATSTVPAKVSNAAPGWKPAKEEDEWVVPGWNAGGAAVGNTGRSSGEIEVEDSYLPFLFSARRRSSPSARDEAGSEPEDGGMGDEDDKGEGTSTAGWQATSGKGGRRSFGGLNQVVEKLSLPPSSTLPPPKEEADDIKPPLIDQDDPPALTINDTIPSSSSSTRPTSSSAPDLQQRPRGFVRPSGFDDSLPSKQSSSSSSTSSTTTTTKPVGSSSRKAKSNLPFTQPSQPLPPTTKKKRKSSNLDEAGETEDARVAKMLASGGLSLADLGLGSADESTSGTGGGKEDGKKAGGGRKRADRQKRARKDPSA